MALGIYFDIDGTLVSSTADKDELYPTAESFGLTIDEETVATHDRLVAQYYRRNISDGYRRATDVWCEQHGFDVNPAVFTRALKQKKADSTRPASGLDDLLSTLAEEVELGILTNGAGDVQRAKLEQHDLDRFFDPILVSGEVDTMKPEDEMFQLAMDTLPAEHHVYVADQFPFDIVPAQENGFLGTLVGETSSPVADLTVTAVTDLTLDALRVQL